MTRSLVALITALLVSPAILACGSTTNTADSSSNATTEAAAVPEPTTPRHQPGPDRDGDNDAHNIGISQQYDKDDHALSHYGQEANAAAAAQIESVVSRYYAAISANDGATACALINAGLAAGFSPNPGSGAGQESCGSAIVTMVRQSMQRSLAELTAIRMFSVRTAGDRAVVFLELTTTEVRLVQLEREDGAWKLSTLLDVGVT